MKRPWSNRRISIIRTVVAITIGLSSFGLHATSYAASLPIVNAGFESPTLSDTAFTSNTIPGWNGTDISAIWNFGAYNPPTGYFPEQAPEGSNVAYIERGAIYQILSSVLTADTDYKLNVFVGDSLVDPLPGFAVQLRAGGEILAETTGPAPLDGSFQLITLDYHASAANPSIGQELEIWFIESAFDKSSEAYFDNVILDAVSTVPEPETYVMLLAGLGSLGFMARRRKESTI